MENQIEVALQEGGHDQSCLRRVEKIRGLQVKEGGPACPHQAGGGWGWRAIYDGERRLIEEGQRAKGGYVGTPHEGCSIRPEILEIEGGTVVVQWEHHQSLNGGWRTRIVALYVTPDADPAMVVELVRGMWGRVEDAKRALRG